ncbi:MAG TPA: type II toxin-antitoxin system prevent-host-death family antitoxin [Phycisphaerae bacterium]|nr:type II toxin-antitoxin system prevent-host-death family antitoxin [Phycisphaerales bacterium]HRX86754.1 type II toxin-antitoxin system prevent-host-death family antitoxin [Phycisphaerae bacterium]
MDIERDIRTLDELKTDTNRVISDVRAGKRPVIITSKGEPELILIPAALLKNRRTALKAACDLATV